MMSSIKQKVLFVLRALQKNKWNVIMMQNFLMLNLVVHKVTDRL
jgi:hypothetical protein